MSIRANNTQERPAEDHCTSVVAPTPRRATTVLDELEAEHRLQIWEQMQDEVEATIKDWDRKAEQFRQDRTLEAELVSAFKSVSLCQAPKQRSKRGKLQRQAAGRFERKANSIVFLELNETEKAQLALDILKSRKTKPLNLLAHLNKRKRGQ